MYDQLVNNTRQDLALVICYTVASKLSRTNLTKKPLLLLYKATAYKKGNDTYVQTSIHNYMYIVLARVFTMIHKSGSINPPYNYIHKSGG